MMKLQMRRREAACQSLARILSIWRNRHHDLKLKAADVLLGARAARTERQER